MVLRRVCTIKMAKARKWRLRKVSGSLSKLRANRRKRVVHAKLRSTTQRLGRSTNPFLASGSFTTINSIPACLASFLDHHLYSLDRHKRLPQNSVTLLVRLVPVLELEHVPVHWRAWHAQPAINLTCQRRYGFASFFAFISIVACSVTTFRSGLNGPTSENRCSHLLLFTFCQADQGT